MKTTEQIHSMISFAPSEDAIGIDTLVDFLYDATASDIANLYQILQNHQAGSCESHEFVGIGGLCDICDGGKKFLIHSGIKV